MRCTQVLFGLLMFLALSSPVGAQQTAGSQASPSDTTPATVDGQRVYQVGGPVKAPVATHHPEANYSDEARRAHYQGVCIVQLIVDTHGKPQDAHVVVSLGMGLDEQALEAVRKWRFKPATLDDRPVPAQINVEVAFHLYQRPE